MSLMERACLAPSALNLQPWRFLICESVEQKERLYRSSCPQEKVLDASVVVVVCGDLRHHENARRLHREAVWVDLAERTYADERRAYEEAVRGCSLWAMTLTLVAHEAGWDTSLIGGFERERLSAAFEVSERYLPVVLIAVGKRVNAPEPRGERLGVAELIIGNPM